MERSITLSLNNSNFLKMFNDEKYTDITLVCEGAVIKSHKIILATTSYYFESLFSLIGETNNPVVVLKDITKDNLIKVLEFIYCGKIKVKSGDFNEFKKLVEYFKLKVDVKEEVNQLDLTLPEFMSQETTVGDLTMENFQISNEFENFDESSNDSELTLVSRTSSIHLSKDRRNEPTPKKPKNDFDLFPLDGKFKCTFCCKFTHEKHLIDHQKHCFKNKNRQTLKCPECRQDYELSMRLRNHIAKKHPAKNPQFISSFF